MPTTDDILAERGQRYGDFDKHADITQSLKAAMASTPGWQRLAPDQREALEMNAHKIGRILNGDPNYADSWEDIAGYAKLVANRLTAQAPKPKDDENCDCLACIIRREIDAESVTITVTSDDDESDIPFAALRAALKMAN